MRFFHVMVAAALVVGCSAPVQKAAEAPAGLTCDQVVTREKAILQDAAMDLLEVRAIAAPPVPPSRAAEDMTDGGRLCAGATIVLTVRDAARGFPVHAFANAMGRMDMVGEGHAGPPFAADALKAYLEGLADAVEVTSTDLAPAFGTERVTSEFAEAPSHDAVVKRKLRMVCHPVSVHDKACFYIDPDQSNAVVPFFTVDQS